MWIVALALRRPYTIAVFSFVILLLGSLAATRMRTDIFPTIDIPVVIVVWNYPGMPAEEMERRVVVISERAFSTTVDGITRIESQSISGIGILKVYFEPEADIGGHDADQRHAREVMSLRDHLCTDEHVELAFSESFQQCL